MNFFKALIGILVFVTLLHNVISSHAKVANEISITVCKAKGNATYAALEYSDDLDDTSYIITSTNYPSNFTHELSILDRKLAGVKYFCFINHYETDKSPPTIS